MYLDIMQENNKAYYFKAKPRGYERYRGHYCPAGPLIKLSPTSHSKLKYHLVLASTVI
jgi:hypothetical protein